MTPIASIVISALIATPPQLEAKTGFNVPDEEGISRGLIGADGRVYVTTSRTGWFSSIWTHDAGGSLERVHEVQNLCVLVPGLGPADELTWYHGQNGTYFSSWRYDSEEGVASQWSSTDDWASAWGHQSIDDDSLGFAGCDYNSCGVQEAAHAVVTIDAGVETVRIADTGYDPKSPYADIGPPFFAADGGFVASVRLVTGARQVLRFEPDGSTSVIVEDVVGDPASPFFEIIGIGAPLDDGRLPMLAATLSSPEGAAEGLYVVDADGRWVELDTSCAAEGTIRHQYLLLSEDGRVRFTARDSDDVDLMCVASPNRCDVIVSEGDILESEAGTFIVNILSHRLTMDATGRILFLAWIADPDGAALGFGWSAWTVDTPASVPGDVTGDGAVNVEDVIQLLAEWGPCAACDADLTGDGLVGVDDLLIVLEHFTA